MSIIKKIIIEIGKQAVRKAWKTARRNEKLLTIMEAVGLKPGIPESTFESVYAYTLIEYGIEQPREHILNLFRKQDIRNAFKKSFEADDFSILHHEADGLVNWRLAGADERIEFAGFTILFNRNINLTRTPAEARREQKLDEILKFIKDKDLNSIRAKNIELIQGSFSDRLKGWFKTLGYSFESHDRKEENHFEWIINIPARRGIDRIFIMGVESQAEATHMEALEAFVKQYNTDEGWLVSGQRMASLAGRKAEETDSLFCYTFDELIDEHADFTRYFDWLNDFVKNRRIDTDYVSLACRRDLYDPNTKEKTGHEIYGKENKWIEGYIDRWIEDPCKEHISILGEFGTGKTWFTHHYAYQKMQEYIEAKKKGLKRPRLPIVIQLRDYSKALDSESLFSDFFFRKHEIPLPGYSAFEQLNRMGRLLLIFDGFDEMADKLDRQKMINNFWELARVVTPGAKAILTCRTEHFPSAKEGRDLLSAELKASTRNLSGDPPQFEILEFEKFDEEQIRAALSRRTDQKTIDLIMKHSELLDLAKRPVMLEFILESLPEIEAEKPVDLSRIYLYATMAKLDRDIKSERTFTSMADKLYFMCELSREMLGNEKMSLNYRLFPERLKNLFGRVVSQEKDLDHWHYDMMGNTLLIRNDEGDYSPAHRSLLEFFVACKIIAEIGMLPEDFTDAFRKQSNINNSLTPVDYSWNSYFKREFNEDDEVKSIQPLRRFRAGNAENTDKGFSYLGQAGETVLRFVHEITNVEEVRYKFHELVSKILNEFRNGIRDPEKQHDIISVILKFRRLSQEWEEKADQGNSIRKFWKEHNDQETGSGKDEVSVETFFLKTAGNDPIEIEMIKAPAGSFLMGDENETPIHRVKITAPFLIGAAPVTQELYYAVTGKSPGRFKGDKLPVETVNWFEAVRFCNDLSEKLNLEPAYNIDDETIYQDRKSPGFRLPTEAEWEFACRGGSTSQYGLGDLETDLENMGWFIENSSKKTHPIKEKLPNSWGIFDMHGNVWEWVWDLYGRYSTGLLVDPTGPISGNYRVIRGGDWGNYFRNCSSSFRFYYEPSYHSDNVGFRLARSITLSP